MDAAGAAVLSEFGIFTLKEEQKMPLKVFNVDAFLPTSLQNFFMHCSA